MASGFRTRVRLPDNDFAKESPTARFHVCVPLALRVLGADAMSTKRNFHSQKQRAAIQWAILELATLSDAWLDLKEARKFRGCRGQIMSALRRALTAVAHAGAGRNTARQLDCVRAAMDDCEMGFSLLHRRAPTIAEDAVRRIAQIVATLDHLERVHPVEWIEVALTPAADANPSRTEAMMAGLREIARRVAAWMSQIAEDARLRNSPAPPTIADRPIVGIE